MTSGYIPLFGSLTTGTLCGHWPDIGLWPIVLSLSDRNGIVDVTPDYLGRVTGLAVPEVEACMARFCQPDLYSRSAEESGARLALLDPQARNWGWRIVNHAKYREKARKAAYDADRTESGRDADRKRAERAAARDVPDSPAASREVPLSDSDQTRADAGKNTDTSARSAGSAGSAGSGARSAARGSKVRPAYEAMEFHHQVIAMYHETLPELQRVKLADWDDERPKALNARIKERLAKGKPAATIEYWRNLFANVATNDHWCGRKPDSSWRASLPWLLKKSNFRKVIDWEPPVRRGDGARDAR